MAIWEILNAWHFNSFTPEIDHIFCRYVFGVKMLGCAFYKMANHNTSYVIYPNLLDHYHYQKLVVVWLCNGYRLGGAVPAPTWFRARPLTCLASRLRGFSIIYNKILVFDVQTFILFR